MRAGQVAGRWCLIVSVVAAVGAAVPAQAVSAARPGGGLPAWRVVDARPGGAYTYDWYGITASGRRDAWAFGNAFCCSPQVHLPVVRHWAGRAWRAVPLPPSIAVRWYA